MQPTHRPSSLTSVTSDLLCLNQKLSELTRSEWKILLCIATDLTNLEIAEKLCLTVKSVENYHTSIGTKLALKGRHKLGQFARKHADELGRYHEQQLKELPIQTK